MENSTNTIILFSYKRHGIVDIFRLQDTTRLDVVTCIPQDKLLGGKALESKQNVLGSVPNGRALISISVVL